MTLNTYFIIGFFMACAVISCVLSDQVHPMDYPMLPVAFAVVVATWPLVVVVTVVYVCGKAACLAYELLGGERQ